jgi:hypothetical protein
VVGTCQYDKEPSGSVKMRGISWLAAKTGYLLKKVKMFVAFRLNSVTASPLFQLRTGANPVPKMFCYCLNTRLWAVSRKMVIPSVKYHHQYCLE